MFIYYLEASGLFWTNASMAVAVLCLFQRIQLRTVNKDFNED